MERDAGGSRLYVQQDANFNVTAVTNTAGAVQERYVYDPYGSVTFYSAGWTNPSSTSSQAWTYLHQGGRYDAATGLYNFRNRDYSPVLGRWMQNDPLGFGGGDANSYRYFYHIYSGQRIRRFLDTEVEPR